MAERRNHRVNKPSKVVPKRTTRGASAKGRKTTKQTRKFSMPKFAVPTLIVPRALIRFLIVSVMMAGIGGAGYFGYAALNLAAQRPIKSVAIEGDFNFVSREEISKLLEPIIVDGFLKLPLMSVKRQLENHPWVAEVNVSRRWPDTLLVSISEQQAIARWGDIGFLNQHGEIVRVEQTPYLASLPWLQGNDDDAQLLMQQYQQFAQLLRPHGLRISAFQADKINDMTVSLNNGLVLNLGKDQVMEKFQRFLLVMQKSLNGRLNQVASVDLRYGNGLAVQWRESETELTNTVARRGL